jgi:hypothetical protein
MRATFPLHHIQLGVSPIKTPGEANLEWEGNNLAKVKVRAASHYETN